MSAALLCLCACSGTALSLDFKSGGTWFNSVEDLPAAILATLEDCPAVRGRYLDSEAAFVVDAGSGSRIFFAACDLGANSNDAAVIYRGGNADRLSFPYVDENGTMASEMTAANLVWRSANDVTARASTGCTGETGVKTRYSFDGSAFVLERQEENDNCDNPEWKTVYE